MSLLRILVSLLLLATASAAHAGEVEDRTARVVSFEAQARTLADERRAVDKVYAERTAAIAALKAQGSSWGRDRKLQALLAESKDMAAALDRKDQQLRMARALADNEKKLLVAAIDRELGAEPRPDAARAALLAKKRSELVPEPLKPLRLPDDHIAPTDDAADLDYKAASLAQGERSLYAEDQRLVARATYFRKQAKLSRSRTRADEADVFRDDEPRRGNNPGSKNGRSDVGNSTDESPPVQSFPGTPSGPTGPTAQIEARTLDLAADPTVILADVVAAGTLDELRRAERSGDPESIAAAAEHARIEVQLRAERLRARRIEMEQRARALRGEKAVP